MEAVGAIGHYSVLFDQEKRIREARASSSKITVSERDFNKIEDILSKPSTANEKLKKALKKTNTEDEDEIVFDAPLRNGPTASELALEKEMKLMRGDSIELTEKTK
jgi:hypothetical protein